MDEKKMVSSAERRWCIHRETLNLKVVIQIYGTFFYHHSTKTIHANNKKEGWKGIALSKASQSKNLSYWATDDGDRIEEDIQPVIHYVK